MSAFPPRLLSSILVVFVLSMHLLLLIVSSASVFALEGETHDVFEWPEDPQSSASGDAATFQHLVLKNFVINRLVLFTHSASLACEPQQQQKKVLFYDGHSVFPFTLEIHNSTIKHISVNHKLMCNARINISHQSRIGQIYVGVTPVDQEYRHVDWIVTDSIFSPEYLLSQDAASFPEKGQATPIYFGRDPAKYTAATTNRNQYLLPLATNGTRFHFARNVINATFKHAQAIRFHVKYGEDFSGGVEIEHNDIHVDWARFAVEVHVASSCYMDNWPHQVPCSAGNFSVRHNQLYHGYMQPDVNVDTTYVGVGPSCSVCFFVHVGRNIDTVRGDMNNITMFPRTRHAEGGSDSTFAYTFAVAIVQDYIDAYYFQFRDVRRLSMCGNLVAILLNKPERIAPNYFHMVGWGTTRLTRFKYPMVNIEEIDFSWNKAREQLRSTNDIMAGQQGEWGRSKVTIADAAVAIRIWGCNTNWGKLMLNGNEIDYFNDVDLITGTAPEHISRRGTACGILIYMYRVWGVGLFQMSHNVIKMRSNSDWTFGISLPDPDPTTYTRSCEHRWAPEPGYNGAPQNETKYGFIDVERWEMINNSIDIDGFSLAAGIDIAQVPDEAYAGNARHIIVADNRISTRVRLPATATIYDSGAPTRLGPPCLYFAMNIFDAVEFVVRGNTLRYEAIVGSYCTGIALVSSEAPFNIAAIRFEDNTIVGQCGVKELYHVIAGILCVPRGPGVVRDIGEVSISRNNVTVVGLAPGCATIGCSGISISFGTDAENIGAIAIMSNTLRVSTSEDWAVGVMISQMGPPSAMAKLLQTSSEEAFKPAKILAMLMSPPVRLFASPHLTWTGATNITVSGNDIDVAVSGSSVAGVVFFSSGLMAPGAAPRENASSTAAGGGLSDGGGVDADTISFVTSQFFSSSSSSSSAHGGQQKSANMSMVVMENNTINLHAGVWSSFNSAIAFTGTISGGFFSLPPMPAGTATLFPIPKGISSAIATQRTSFVFGGVKIQNSRIKFTGAVHSAVRFWANCTVAGDFEISGMDISIESTLAGTPTPLAKPTPLLPIAAPPLLYEETETGYVDGGILTSGTRALRRIPDESGQNFNYEHAQLAVLGTLLISNVDADILCTTGEAKAIDWQSDAFASVLRIQDSRIRVVSRNNNDKAGGGGGFSPTKNILSPTTFLSFGGYIGSLWLHNVSALVSSVSSTSSSSSASGGGVGGGGSRDEDGAGFIDGTGMQTAAMCGNIVGYPGEVDDGASEVTITNSSIWLETIPAATAAAGGSGSIIPNRTVGLADGTLAGVLRTRQARMNVSLLNTSVDVILWNKKGSQSSSFPSDLSYPQLNLFQVPQRDALQVKCTRSSSSSASGGAGGGNGRETIVTTGSLLQRSPADIAVLSQEKKSIITVDNSNFTCSSLPLPSGAPAGNPLQMPTMTKIKRSSFSLFKRSTLVTTTTSSSQQSSYYDDESGNNAVNGGKQIIIRGVPPLTSDIFLSCIRANYIEVRSRHFFAPAVQGPGSDMQSCGGSVSDTHSRSISVVPECGRFELRQLAPYPAGSTLRSADARGNTRVPVSVAIFLHSQRDTPAPIPQRMVQGTPPPEGEQQSDSATVFVVNRRVFTDKNYSLLPSTSSSTTLAPHGLDEERREQTTAAESSSSSSLWLRVASLNPSLARVVSASVSTRRQLGLVLSFSTGLRLREDYNLDFAVSPDLFSCRNPTSGSAVDDGSSRDGAASSSKNNDDDDDDPNAWPRFTIKVVSSYRRIPAALVSINTAGGVAAIALAASGNPSGMMAVNGLRAVVGSTECEFSLTDGLPVTEAPLGLAVGHPVGRHLRGAVLGNFLLLVIIASFLLTVAYINYRRSQQKFLQRVKKKQKQQQQQDGGHGNAAERELQRARAFSYPHFRLAVLNTGLPSFLLVPAYGVIQGTMSSAAALLLHGGGEGRGNDWLFGVFGIAVPVLLLLWNYWAMGIALRDRKQVVYIIKEKDGEAIVLGDASAAAGPQSVSEAALDGMFNNCTKCHPPKQQQQQQKKKKKNANAVEMGGGLYNHHHHHHHEHEQQRDRRIERRFKMRRFLVFRVLLWIIYSYGDWKLDLARNPDVQRRVREEEAEKALEHDRSRKNQRAGGGEGGAKSSAAKTPTGRAAVLASASAAAAAAASTSDNNFHHHDEHPWKEPPLKDREQSFLEAMSAIFTDYTYIGRYQMLLEGIVFAAVAVATGLADPDQCEGSSMFITIISCIPFAAILATDPFRRRSVAIFAKVTSGILCAVSLVVAISLVSNAPVLDDIAGWSSSVMSFANVLKLGADVAELFLLLDLSKALVPLFMLRHYLFHHGSGSGDDDDDGHHDGRRGGDGDDVLSIDAFEAELGDDATRRRSIYSNSGDDDDDGVELMDMSRQQQTPLLRSRHVKSCCFTLTEEGQLSPSVLIKQKRSSIGNA